MELGNYDRHSIILDSIKNNVDFDNLIRLAKMEARFIKGDLDTGHPLYGKGQTAKAESQRTPH